MRKNTWLVELRKCSMRSTSHHKTWRETLSVLRLKSNQCPAVVDIKRKYTQLTIMTLRLATASHLGGRDKPDALVIYRARMISKSGEETATTILD